MTMPTTAQCLPTLPDAVPEVPVLPVAARLAEKERENKSLAARNAALIAALNGVMPTRAIATLRGAAKLEPALRIARLLEEQGRVPVLRFLRDRVTGTITGIELATIEPDPIKDAPSADGSFAVLEDEDGRYVEWREGDD